MHRTWIPPSQEILDLLNPARSQNHIVDSAGRDQLQQQAIAEDLLANWKFDDTHTAYDSSYTTPSLSRNISPNISPSPMMIPMCKGLFSNEEYEKLPSTLVKALRRTDALMLTTENARKNSINLHNEVKYIHSLVVRYARKLLKDENANGTNEDTPDVENGQIVMPSKRGFKLPGTISNEMCHFLGVQNNTKMSRVDVNNAIHTYIKKNQLIDPVNGKMILPDDKLRALLSPDAEGQPLTYFSIQKYIKHHFIPKHAQNKSQTTAVEASEL